MAAVMRILALAAAIVAAANAGPALIGHRAVPTAAADLVIVDGKIVTVDPAFSLAQGVAVRAGRVDLVGTSDEVRARIGPATRVIDARGRTVIPGLIDSHVHALGAAPAEVRAPFRTLTSVAELQDWLRAEAARTPAPAWVWSPRVYPTRLREGRFPTREELDAAVPDRPAVADGAYAFVLNSAALRAAGLSATTVDPPGTAIVRDRRGAPTGLLRNAGTLLAPYRVRTAADVPLDQVEALHRSYLATGITSIVERGGSVAGYRAYEALRRAGRLHVRASVTLHLGAAVAADDAVQVIETLPLRSGQGDDRLKVGALKVAVDGGILLGTSYMREPYGPASRTLYGDQGPAYRGVPSMSPEAIRAVVLAGHTRGWQMTAHVTGDAGVDVVLDAFEAAQREHPRPDPRHTLIHAYFPTPAVAARVASLGVLVDTQPAWFYEDVDALLGALGPARLSRFIGLKTWRDAGVRVAINTDHMFGADRDTAMNPFNPFLTMATAVTRRTRSGRVVAQAEAVSRRDALRMMTIDAAALTFDEEQRGSIEVGKLADLVVLSEDLLTVPATQLSRITADVTVVGGVVVHERSRR